MDITYPYTKLRCGFGRQLMFCEQGPELCDSIPVNVNEHKLFILRNPVHQPTQNTPCYSVHPANTYTVDYTNSGAWHSEGGWPRDVPVTDPEATQRYRRKVEKDEGYIHCVMAQAKDMDHYILQNNAIDMYETFYGDMETTPPIERNSLRTVNVYRDPQAPRGGGRPVSSIAWQPDGHNFTVTYVDIDFYRIPKSSNLCYIWDLESANSPLVTLAPPYPTFDMQYNPRDINVLAGGLSSGQVALWDRRTGGAPVNICPPHVAHRDIARNVLFVSSKSGQEFYSSGPDGECKWWDCRKLDDYVDNMIIDVVKSANDTPTMANSYGVSVLEFEPTVPTRFMVGTDNGLVISGNRKGKTPLDKLSIVYETHLGPVWSLERNPAFLKNFLTVGDWTVRVWSEECRESAVLWSPPMRHKVTNAAWSPTRLSLMLTVQWDGLVAAWDLLRRQHVPVLTMPVSYLLVLALLTEMACRLSLMLTVQWDGLVAAWDLLRRQHVPVLTMPVSYLLVLALLTEMACRLSLMLTVQWDGLVAAWDLLRRQHVPVLTMPVSYLLVLALLTEMACRLSLMLTVQWDGLVAAWDLLRRQHVPVLTMHVCDEPLLKLKVHELGSLAACGSNVGSVYMVEMSPNLTQSTKNEKTQMTAMLEREAKRERILETRMREIRLKMRQAEEGSPQHSIGEPDPSAGGADLHEAATDYFAQVKKEAALMH